MHDLTADPEEKHAINRRADLHLMQQEKANGGLWRAAIPRSWREDVKSTAWARMLGPMWPGFLWEKTLHIDQCFLCSPARQGLESRLCCLQCCVCQRLFCVGGCGAGQQCGRWLGVVWSAVFWLARCPYHGRGWITGPLNLGLPGLWPHFSFFFFFSKLRDEGLLGTDEALLGTVFFGVFSLETANSWPIYFSQSLSLFLLLTVVIVELEGKTEKPQIQSHLLCSALLCC